MTKRKIGGKSSKSRLERLFGPRIGRRVAGKTSQEYVKLSPSRLKRLGLSPKSERYVEKGAKRITTKTPTLSKRQFYQKKLSERAGRPVTLEQRSREYLTGDREALTAKQASLRDLSLRAWVLRKKYKSERVSRIRTHLQNMEIKARGDHLDRDVYLREKAFAEAHLDVAEEQAFYQKWFNYGHVKAAVRRGHDARGRTI
jgi:hypothetical protein